MNKPDDSSDAPALPPAKPFKWRFSLFGMLLAMTGLGLATWLIVSLPPWGASLIYNSLLMLGCSAMVGAAVVLRREKQAFFLGALVGAAFWIVSRGDVLWFTSPVLMLAFNAFAFVAVSGLCGAVAASTAWWLIDQGVDDEQA